MARFRKNDFLKWAQKIKSVFCFIPHTHEGCDWADARISDMVKEFQSTHTKDVPLIFMHDEDIVHESIIMFEPFAAKMVEALIEGFYPPHLKR